jgi:glyoxylate reductase
MNMSKPKVFITKPIPQPALDRLQAQADVEVWQEPFPPSQEILIKKASTCDGILCMLVDPLDAVFFKESGSTLKVVSQFSVGVDNIDLDAAASCGIPVGHTPGVLTETTADFAFGLMMAAARRIVEGNNEVQQGIWRPWGPDVLTGYDIYGATLGLIGFGRIGQAVARRASGFSMKVIYYDTTRDIDLEEKLGVTYAPFDQILEQPDFISLHIYLSPETYHMIGKAEFEKMKPSVILVNTARGGVIDPQALAWALENQRIAGAALDVTEPEPIPRDSPLLGLRNVIIAPHIASASKATRLRMAHITVDNLLAGMEDLPLPFCANPSVYTKGLIRAQIQ